MNRTFDHFGYPELPYIVLTNPDKTQLCSLGLAYDTKMSYRYNAISEFTFEFPQSIDSGVTTLPQYDQIKNKKLVLVENFGYFVINNVTENMDGSVPIKSVTCNSLEYELISKRVSGYGGTVKLYNDISPTGTLLYYLVSLAPNWTVGTIESSLELLYRTFDVTDTNIYELLLGEVSNAFQCVFIFDTNNRTISAVSQANATSASDIFLSFDNLLEKAELTEKTDEITTCLSVYGGGNLDIRSVNPLGTDRIYDFSYYMTTDWMSSGLISAITAWEAAISSSQASYASLLSSLKTYNADLITLESGLATYENEYLVLEGIQKVRIQGSLSYADVTILMTAKQAQIDAQEVLITNKQTLQINPTLASIQAINTAVSFSTNFTSPQLLELNNFIYENTYQNANIIQTDIMTSVQIQDAQQALYDQANEVLSRVSQPRYELSFEAVNYLELPEFSEFSTQTELGSVFYVELSETQSVESVLLEINITFDNPTDFSMVFSNRLRLDGGKFRYSDLFGNVVKTGSKVAFDNLMWSNWDTTYKDDVSLFITSALDTTTNNLISNSNQEILINQNGLRGRTIIPSTTNYEPTQVWLTSSVLAFSDDAFVTSKLALGKVTVGAITKFGLVADVVYGRLLAGNSLSITNEGSNFLLDSTGATLTNAKFTVTNALSKVSIDLNDSGSKIFKIQKFVTGVWTDKFWIDSSGNVNYSGTLSAATGTFSGSLSAATGTFAGSLSAATGTFSGSLSAASGTFSGDITGASGTFSGTIRADRLYGLVSYSQLTDIPFLKVTSGTTVAGTTLTWPGGFHIYDGGYNFGILSAPRIEIDCTLGAGSYLTLDNGVASLNAAAILLNGTVIEFNGGAKIYGTLYSSGSLYTGYGLNSRQPISTPSGTRYMYFAHGVVVGVLTS